MIAQAPVFALLLADLVGVLLLLPAALFALQLLRQWDPASGRAVQLQLEKRTHLVGAVLGLVLLAQLLALPLFVHVADRMALQIAGAMCAVGTLNANAWGFPALLLRIALFFLAAAWLVLHRLDVRAPDYPLIRVKYALLLAILPLAVATLVVQLTFFLRLDPEVITSCCGSLFSRQAESVAAHLAGLPPLPAMVALYTVLGLAIAAGLAYLRRRRGLLPFALLATSAFPAGIAAIVAFVSLYVYEHPLHHCPFCLLKPEYGYVGYALYLPLFVAAALGFGLTTAAAGSRSPAVRGALQRSAPTLVAVSVSGLGAFGTLSAWLSWRSNLILLGY